jgi:hypothetical protein
MEDPREQLQDALKQAMREKNVERRNVLRMIQSAIKQVEIDTRKTLSAEDIVGILQKEAKLRRESIDELDKAGNDEEAAQARHELTIVEEFLPQQMSRAELETIVDEVIAQVGATSPKDTGKVMGALMPRVKGRADGALVNQIVREKLNN